MDEFGGDECSGTAMPQLCTRQGSGERPEMGGVVDTPALADSLDPTNGFARKVHMSGRAALVRAHHHGLRLTEGEEAWAVGARRSLAHGSKLRSA